MSSQRKFCQGYGRPKKGPPPATLRSRPRRPGVDFVFPNEAAQRASLMRHSWYRRKMRKERPDEECWW